MIAESAVSPRRKAERADTAASRIAKPLAPTDQTNADGHRPIIVTLTDRPRRILEAGATFSTAEGSGVDLIWTWRW